MSQLDDDASELRPNSEGKFGREDVARGVGERLRFARDELHLTQPALANKLGISLSAMQGYEAGKNVPGGLILRGLQDVGIDPSWLLSGEGNMRGEASVRDVGPPPYGSPERRQADELVYLPLYDVQAAAGSGRVNQEVKVARWLAFRRDWIHSELRTSAGDLYLLYIEGDSMSPTLEAGDVVLSQRVGSSSRRDGLHVLRIGETLLVKRLQFLPGARIHATSDNPAYQSFTIEPDQVSDLEIVGRIVWMARKLV